MPGGHGLDTRPRRLVLGIDPGKSGAVVAFDPANGDAQGWRAEAHYVNAGAYDLPAMRTLLVEAKPLLVILERQQAMPATLRGRALGGSSTFSIAENFGVWQGLLAGLEIPYAVIHPATWTASMLKGAPGEGKARAIAVCQRRLPQLVLTPGKLRVPHSGLADAACLALYGARVNGWTMLAENSAEAVPA